MLPLIPFALGLVAGGFAVKALRGRRLRLKPATPLAAAPLTDTSPAPASPQAAQQPPAPEAAGAKPAPRRKRAPAAATAAADKKPAAARPRAAKPARPAETSS